MDPATISELVERFHTDGFVEIADVLDTAMLADLCTVANNNFDEAMQIIEENSLEFGIGTKNGFKEIVQRHTKRFEMPYKMDNAMIDEVKRSSTVGAVVRGILGEDATVINQSAIINMPGADAQAWHVDGAHVSTSKHLPCHVLNVFVPLVDMQLELGPTEFRPGSHHYSRDLTRMFFVAAMKKTLRAPVTPLPRRGSVVLFDYRVLHRGTANTTEVRRPVLAVTYAKTWFKDIVNFPHRSLLQVSADTAPAPAAAAAADAADTNVA